MPVGSAADNARRVAMQKRRIARQLAAARTIAANRRRIAESSSGGGPHEKAKPIAQIAARERRSEKLVEQAHKRSQITRARAMGFKPGHSWLGRALAGLPARAYQMPGGIYGLGKGGGHDVAAAMGYLPHASRYAKHARREGFETPHIAKQTATGTWESIRHPGRDPSATLLTGLAALSAGAGAASRVAAASDALRAGEGVSGAALRAGHRGGSLLHRPEPGTVEIAPGIHKLLSRNALRRQVQKAQAGRVRRAVEEGREAPQHGSRLGRKIGDELSAHSTVGRELRAQRRVESDLSNTHTHELHHALRGLNRGEHSAIGVVGVEGKVALEKPSEVIARHVATHERFIEELRAEIPKKRGKARQELARAIRQNEDHVRNLFVAGKALENPSDKLTHAIAVTHRVANETELESVKRGLLDAGQASGRRAKIAELYGRTGGAPEGSFYFPLSKAYTEAFRRGSKPKPYQPALPETGLGKPTPGRYMPGRGHEFTGRSVKLGGLSPRVGEHVADVASRRHRLFSAQDFHKRLREHATDEKVSESQIPIRETARVSDELKRVLSKAEERSLLGEEPGLSEVEAQEIAQAVVARDIEHEGATKHHGSIPVGTRLKGVKWVDKRLVKDVEAMGPRSGLGEVVDAVSRPFRFAYIYARPAYILNKLGNWTMLAVTEGARFPQVIRDAQLAESKLGGELLAKIDAGVGQSRTASYLATRSRAGKLTHDVQSFWQRITDQTERRAAFFGEARRGGYTDEAGWKELLTSDAPEISQKRIEVFRRARKNIVDFDSMTPAEQEAARLVFVYPWLTRGSAWAVHATLEHPAKVATLANLGEATHKDLLGGLSFPSWLEGVIPLHIGGKTFLINPSSINTYATGGRRQGPRRWSAGRARHLERPQQPL
jgi:hypothetical protein